MNPTVFRKQLLLAAMSAALAMGAAHAQTTESTDEPTAPPSQSQATPAPADEAAAPPAQAATQLDDQKIEQFANAYVAVQEIQQRSAQKLDNTADPAKQQQDQAAVENEMIAAVEKSGLKLEEFNSIVQSMTADVNLRARVVGKIRERTGG